MGSLPGDDHRDGGGVQGGVTPVGIPVVRKLDTSRLKF